MKLLSALMVAALLVISIPSKSSDTPYNPLTRPKTSTGQQYLPDNQNTYAGTKDNVISAKKLLEGQNKALVKSLQEKRQNQKKVSGFTPPK